MNELKDVKSVLKDILCFAQRIDPGCVPTAVFSQRTVTVWITDVNHFLVSSFLQYFWTLMRNVDFRRWRHNDSLDAKIELDHSHLHLKCQINFFVDVFGTDEDMIELFKKDGSKIRYNTLRDPYLLWEINLD